MDTMWFHYMQYLGKFTDIESRTEVLGGRWRGIQIQRHMCSVGSDSETPRTVAHQALRCMAFSRQEYQLAGCHFLLQGIVLTQRLNLSFLHLSSVLAGGLFTMSATWEALPASGWGPIRGRRGCPGDEAVLRQVILAHQLCQTPLGLHCTLRGFLPSHISPSQGPDPQLRPVALPTSLQDPPHFFNRLM